MEVNEQEWLGDGYMAGLIIFCFFFFFFNMHLKFPIIKSEK